MFVIALSFLGSCAFAQTVAPVIVEYKMKASGKFALTNNTLTPMAVVLEPKSFSITPDGNGVYRPLDPDIHVQLSAMSFRLDPKQTYYVFYKATADKLPAWFTVYSVFSSLRHSSGLDVRILLPHTVYIYPKKPLQEKEVHLSKVAYLVQSKTIVCDLQNDGADLGRVQEVRVTSGHESATAAGFPLLPGGRRHVEVSWDGKQAPQMLQLRFEHFTIKQPLNASN
jgi:hypothetical protein